MASISSAGRTNLTSSLYNSANIISGLASGLDTEGMIEGLVESYNTKIQNLTNQATKIEWKQDSYRDIISKMYAFSNKYTSYTSSTNLLSQSFFSNAVNVAAQGENAAKVSASGRTDSDIIIKSVSQLAAAARYVTGSNLGGAGDGTTITAGKEVDLGADMTLGTLQGSLSLTYGGTSISLSFSEDTDKFKSKEELVSAIREKLEKETIAFSGGSSAKASDRIDVSLNDDGNIVFKEKGNAGNSLYISGATGTVATALNLKGVTGEDKVSTIKVGSGNFTKQVNTAEYLSNKGFNISLDGTTKTIYAPKIEKNDDGTYTFTKPTSVKDASGQIKMTYEGGEKIENVKAEDLAKTYTDIISDAVKDVFGSKVTVSNAYQDSDAAGSQLQLQFKVQEGSELLVNTDAGEVLDIGKSATNYLSTGKTLKELGVDFEGLEGVYTGEGDDKKLQGYRFTINGKEIGVYNEDTKLSDIMNDINSNSEAGVKVSYSRTTREFVFSAKDTGSEGKVELGDGLAAAMFGRRDVQVDEKQKIKDLLGMGSEDVLKGKTFSVEFDNGQKAEFQFIGEGGSLKDLLGRVNESLPEGTQASFDKHGQLVIQDADGKTYGVRSYGGSDEIASKLDQKLQAAAGGVFTAGQDAKFVVSVNGTEKEMTRSSNTTAIDGLTVKLKGTFEDDGEGVSFQRSVDADKIVDAVKSMISDYNDMMGTIRKAYATLPYQNSSGAFQSYEPLSDEDKATMSESAIQAYEEKAKQGILFGDRNLSGLYEKLRNAFSATGVLGRQLTQMGISVGYDGGDGSTYITLDESKLREQLENDPDGVTEAFVGSSSQQGIMQAMKDQLDRYAGTTGAVKGILVEQAGTPLSSASLLSNAWQKQIDSLGTQVEKWQDKLSDRVDYYTSMFSKLEVLINQMNSQSSTLAGLMGG